MLGDLSIVVPCYSLIENSPLEVKFPSNSAMHVCDQDGSCFTFIKNIIQQDVNKRYYSLFCVRNETWTLHDNEVSSGKFNFIYKRRIFHLMIALKVYIFTTSITQLIPLSRYRWYKISCPTRERYSSFGSLLSYLFYLAFISWTQMSFMWDRIFYPCLARKATLTSSVFLTPNPP